MALNTGKIALFVGNGFAQGLGFPSMGELWDVCLSASGPRYAPLLEEAKKQYPLAAFMEKGIRDIELLLTVWRATWEGYEEYLGGSWQESGRGAFANYIENLCNHLYRFTIQGIQTTEFRDFQSVIVQLSRERNLVLITTNYDLLLEAVIRQAGLSYTLQDDAKNGTIPIRKLHGSISWMSSAHKVVSEVGKLRLFFQGSKPEGKVYDLTTDCFRVPVPTLEGMYMQWGQQIFETNVTPIASLIPPLVGKKYNELFKYILGCMQRDFSGLDCLVVIGYSFPEADPFIRAYITQLCMKYKTPRIIVVNDNKHVCERAKAYFKNIDTVTICERWKATHLEAVS